MVWPFRWLCPGCVAAARRASGLCVRCHARVQLAPSVLGAQLVSLGAYRGALGRMVRSAKYTPDRALLRTLGLELGRRVRVAWPDLALVAVVPVPGDPKRRRQRGVDHARLLAVAVADALGPTARVAPMLRRVRAGPAQSTLPHAAREANVRHAIVADVRQRRDITALLLIDDVITSGATVRACQAALGAAPLRVAVVAMGGRPTPPTNRTPHP